MQTLADLAISSSCVYVIIPVFNRLELTKSCLDCLSEQSYAPLELIVVDGGSTDGTPEYLRQYHPLVTVLQSNKELWWGQAMEFGIAHCLARSRSDDMVLMMNNDTLIDHHYIETLVRVSREHNAAIGGLVVDSRDTACILDAGEYINWSSYSFSVRTAIESHETYTTEIDVLSGRGTLVPLSMVRTAGNVNGSRFPHYIADYEFFLRLKRRGFGLGVTYEAVVRSHVDVTGLSSRCMENLTFIQAWKALFSRRSMDNLMDHWRFVRDCAPSTLQRHVHRQLIRRSLYLVASRTKLRHVVLPLAWFLTGTYYVTGDDCTRCGCSTEGLLRTGLLKRWKRSDWYVLSEEVPDQMGSRPELKRLYRRAWNPVTKISRWLKAKTEDRLSGGDRRKLGQR